MLGITIHLTKIMSVLTSNLVFFCILLYNIIGDFMKKIIAFSFLAALIDQLIKLIIINNVSLYSNIKVIENFFYITYVKNTGAAFSILTGNVIVLVLITLIALVIIYKYLIKGKSINKLMILTYSLLIGGIIGNLIDRIFRGFVIDYLDFYIFKYNFPVFNFADICIVVSAILLILFGFKEKNDGIQSK